MIHISNLSIGYRQHGGDRLVASGIEANIEGGRLTCLIGANGAGKSTLLKTLAAFIPKLGGSIYIKGKEISEYTHKELSRTVGVVLTTKPEGVNMTVSDVVTLGRTPYTGFWGMAGSADKHIVNESME